MAEHLPSPNPYNDLPPLGRIPIFDADKKIASNAAAEVAYRRIDLDPQLAPAFHDVTAYAEEFLDRYGMPAKTIDPNAIRMLSAKNMARVLGLLQRQEHAVYDRRTDIVYVQEPEQRDSVSLAGFNYAVSHEIGHQLTPALCSFYQRSDDCYTLREGIADVFARGYMHGVYLPAHAPNLDILLSQQFADDKQPYECDGVLLRREDVIFAHPATLAGVGFSRMFEMGAVDTLEKRLGAVAFAEMMRRTTEKDVLSVRQLVVAERGIETWRLLTADPSVISPLEASRRMVELG